MDVFTEANNQREKRKMLKTLTMGLSLSLLSLSAWALPDTIDVSGVEIGSDMQEAVNQLQEKYPEEEVEVYSFEDGGIGRIIVKQNYDNKWEISPVPDGSGRVGYIERRQGFDDNNVGLEATLEALRNKYGQEVFHEDDYFQEWYWAGLTDDAADDFEIDNAPNAMASASLLYKRGEFTKERTENIRAYVHVKIKAKQGGDLVESMETTVYWVEPAHDHAFAYLEEQRAIKEAEEQRNLEEAGAADI
ncbi:hypothetical protein OM427_12110 [Halomonas sp. 18H]|nr:hypothetical protein [Halomonas sp. 18H]MCW4150269.1 hypothetical protein [Halomonas sp. 18H]